MGLLELVLALVILALLTTVGLRGLAALRDAWGVVGARDALVGLVREARARAVARGGARVTLSTAPPGAVLEAGGTTLRGIDLASSFGVGLDLGGPTEVTLVFDPAGVGRMTARTLRLGRGASGRTLRVSAYGRVR